MIDSLQIFFIYIDQNHSHVALHYSLTKNNDETHNGQSKILSKIAIYHIYHQNIIILNHSYTSEIC